MSDSEISGDLDEVEKLLYSTLKEDTGSGGLMTLTCKGATLTGIHSHVAKQGAALPYVVFSLQSGGADERALCGDTVLSDPLYLVRVIGRDCGFEGLRAFERRIYQLLHKLTYTTEGGMEIECRRETPFRLPTPAPGGGYDFAAGGLYRFTVSV